MHRAKRAVILAAGAGKRMHPVTLRIPKPLVTVNGIRMIDTAIRGLWENGIREIYIVTGYRKEQFMALEKEYPGVCLIENPYYDTCNNISSLYMARECLEDSFILDGDQMIYNAEILRPEFERSGYHAVWTDSFTNEWLLDVEDGVIAGCSRTGGKCGLRLVSVSRWNAEDGRHLKQHLETEFKKHQNTRIYWDDIPVFCYPEQYRLGIRVIQPDDMVEIDSLEELAELDHHYTRYLKEAKQDEKKRQA